MSPGAGSSNRGYEEIPILPKPNPVAALIAASLTAVGKQLPSSQVILGDNLLNQARDLVTSDVPDVVANDDLEVTKSQIA